MEAFVYFSQLLGTRVLDPRSEALGRLADLIVPAGERYPRVQALVVRGRGASGPGGRGGRAGRRQVEIPWSAVAALDPDAWRLATPAQALPPFEPGGPVLWLARDLLDKQIVDTFGAKVVRVNDLHLLRSDLALVLVHVDVGLRGLLRRLGWERVVEGAARFLRRNGRPVLEERLIGWPYVQPLPARPGAPLQLTVPQAQLAELHPADLASILADLDAQDRVALFRSLDAETAAGALGELPPKLQVSLLEAVPPERAADILEEMPADEAADVVGDLPEEQAREVLARMESDERADVAALLAHPEETAGGLMTSDFVALPEHYTVEEAVAALRNAARADTEVLYYVYVTGADGRLVGVLTLKDLLIAPGAARLGELMRPDPVTVRADAPADAVVDVMAKYYFAAVPIVDEEKRLVGIVTMDDILRRVFARAGRRAG
ncbi:MAG TPA: CBS domain-containing protein [Thermodesulfobacteriota bacterium]|nr:CBS domain-containing protein [Thermodesulfobacteriota bacterium]